MFLDARSVPSDTMIDSDFGIVVGGAVRIALAREFAGSRFGVVLFERVSMAFEHGTQALYGLANPCVGGRSVFRPAA
jgi:hypothetical protein